MQIYQYKDIEFYHLPDCTMEEKKLVWKWRNNENISKYMINDKKFTFKNHLSFLESLVTKHDKKFILVKFKGRYIGVIDYYDINGGVCFWGYYLNPDYLDKGYGFLLEYMVCEYAFTYMGIKELKCETFEYNERALDMHNYFGFTRIGSSYYVDKNKNDRKAIIMRYDKDSFDTFKSNNSFVERFFD